MGVCFEKSNIAQLRKYLNAEQEEYENKIDSLSKEELENTLEWLGNDGQWQLRDEKMKDVFVEIIYRINSLRSHSADIVISDDYDMEELELNSIEYSCEGYEEWKNEFSIAIFLFDGGLPRKFSIDEYNLNRTLLSYNQGKYTTDNADRCSIIYVNNDLDLQSTLLQLVADEDFNDVELTNEKVYKLFDQSRKVEIEHLYAENEQKSNIIERLEDELKRYKSRYGDLDDNYLSAGEEEQQPQNMRNVINDREGNVVGRGDLSREDQIVAHKEAEQVVKMKLERAGYDCSNWTGEHNSEDNNNKWQSVNQVKGILTPTGETINMVVKSARYGYIYLSATDFEFLTSDKNNVLMVWDGKEAHSVTAEEIFNKDSNVNLIFDTEYTPKHYYAALSKMFQFVKRTTFAVKNPDYNAYDAIKSFGMDAKIEGIQELFDDNAL